jgi:hypothetical protein
MTIKDTQVEVDQDASPEQTDDVAFISVVYLFFSARLNGGRR